MVGLWYDIYGRNQSNRRDKGKVKEKEAGNTVRSRRGGFVRLQDVRSCIVCSINSETPIASEVRGLKRDLTNSVRQYTSCDNAFRMNHIIGGDSNGQTTWTKAGIQAMPTSYSVKLDGYISIPWS